MINLTSTCNAGNAAAKRGVKMADASVAEPLKPRWQGRAWPALRKNIFLLRGSG